MRPIHALPVVLVAAAVAGCGGGGDSTTTSDPSTPPATTQSQAQTQTTRTTAPAKGADGADVFVSAGCGGCHTLAAARTNGNVGPNLDDLQPDFATVQAQVENGGGGMPAFKDRLSQAEIREVARFVANG